MLHKIFRASNKVWNAMYYDELLDTDDFQISYLKEADRLYFNAAHALASASSEILDTIEFYFKQRSMQPGVYLDPANPTALEETLLQRGYSLAEEEEENWYVLECNKASLEDFETKIKEFQIKNQSLECIVFVPTLPSILLDQFLELNGYVNSISTPALQKLKDNLLNSKDPKIQFICIIARENEKAISTGLIGLYNNMAFLAEGATHPKFRQRGIYSWLSRIATLYAIKQNCNLIAVNCYKTAFSNHTFRRLGFSLICTRVFYTKSN